LSTPGATPEAFFGLIRRQQRGRFKIYIGYAPGVGKSYQMLQEGHRLKQLGLDVVIAIIEPQGRHDLIHLMQNLELAPRRVITLADIHREELDVDALLARRPMVALVAELARSNAPGARHRKRYQDVEEVLAAGIHVITTVDMDDLEGAPEPFEQMPGQRMKNRIPDYIIGMADEIVDVDVPPEVVRERLLDRKIYTNEQTIDAYQRFFTLAMLEERRQRFRQIVPRLRQRHKLTRPLQSNGRPAERVMACISAHGPNPARLLRRAAELAGPRGVPWFAVTVAGASPNANGEASEILRMVKDLGGIPLTFQNSDLVGTIAAFVQEYHITHLLVGRSRRSRLAAWFRPTMLDRIVRAISQIDITVVDTSED
jgi:two-component system sensor histidine kinase KdpD